MLVSQPDLSFGFEIDITWGESPLTAGNTYLSKKHLDIVEAYDYDDDYDDDHDDDEDDGDYDDNGHDCGHLDSAPSGENPPRSNSNFRITGQNKFEQTHQLLAISFKFKILTLDS